LRSHAPVLIDEVVELLGVRPGSIVLDCTLGSGGISLRLCEKIGKSGCLIGIDRDEDALQRAQGTLGSVCSKVFFYKCNFACLDEALSNFKIKSVDGIVLDLGVSSEQLETPARGFSFIHDGPLDMRMDAKSAKTAADLVNALPQDKLEELLRSLGEEYEARKIARRICEARSRGSIKTTRELADIIFRAVNPKRRHRRTHPATKTFQALRIAVNDELGSLECALPKAVNVLKPGGRVAVIAFHSLEDRIVKNFFKQQHKAGVLSILTKKVVKPQAAEIERNPRARSAHLRVAEKRLSA